MKGNNMYYPNIAVRRFTLLKRMFVVLVASIIAVSFLSGCKVFRKGRYNGSHFKMQFPKGWKQGSWTIPTVLPAEKLYEAEQFTAESPRRHKATGTPDASITLFAQKMEQVVWMEDLYPMILREYRRAGYKILQKGEIKVDGQISKWILCKNVERNEVAMDFYIISDSSVFYKIQYASHLDTFNKYRKDFEKAKSDMIIKINFI